MTDYIDINTSDYVFDVASDLPLPGTWYRYGWQDGMNSFEKRALTAPFDVFQAEYESGFADGQYMKTYLVDPRP